MRVTFSGSFVDGTAEITKAAAALAEAQRRVSSGRRINAPSDDPAGSESAIGDRATIARMDAYTAASDAAESRLSVADAALSDMVNQISAAQTTALGARGSTQTPEQRAALSTELLSIRDALMSDINTKFHGTYLFSGSEVTTAPYAVSGSTFTTYQGDATQAQVDMGDGRTVPMGFNGGSIFQGGEPQHLLDQLTTLAAAVAAGDNAAIGQGIDALDRAFTRVTSAQSTVGNSLRLIDDTRAQTATARLAALTRASKVEDADIAQALTDLSRTETALRAALQSLSTIGQFSLMDYLR